MAGELDPREKWNRRHAARGLSPLLQQPSAWLVENRSLLHARRGLRALDVACGGGRNAVYLAQLGFEVEALDISDHAIRELRAAAAASSLPVRPRCVDLEQEGLPAGPFDVVLQLNYLQRDLFGALAESLAPGGLLLVETRLRTERADDTDEFNPRFALERGELRAAFGQLEIIRYQEAVVSRGDRRRTVASLAARRHNATGT